MKPYRLWTIIIDGYAYEILIETFEMAKLAALWRSKAEVQYGTRVQA